MSSAVRHLVKAPIRDCGRESGRMPTRRGAVPEALARSRAPEGRSRPGQICSWSKTYLGTLL